MADLTLDTVRVSDAATSVRWILGDADLPAHIDPASTALRWGDTARTYAELRDRSVRLAAGLRAAGLRVGDRVSTLLHNRGETFELYFACAYAGLTLVPVNFRMVVPEVEFVLRDSGARFLVTEPALADVASGATAGLAAVQVISLDTDAPGAQYADLVATPPISGPFVTTEPHLILYTSGTTGRPKGVMLSHTAITWFALQQSAFYPAMASDVVTLVTGPTYNASALHDLSIPTFLLGGTVSILPSRGWSPEKMSDLIDRHAVTHTLVFPGMIEPFLAADADEPIGFASLRFVLMGGDNCPTATVARFRARWDHVSVAVCYGLTESGVITWSRDDELDAHPGSVGRAFGGQTYQVVDEEGRTLPDGEVGEIVTAGPVVTSGYWNAPDLTEATIRDGWFWTGDLGRRGEDGHLYIGGRSKDVIISGGQNVYPAELENALSEHTGLLEATVIGVPDERWGEAVCAIVVPKPGVDLQVQDIVEFVQARLASYKKPRHVVFTDELPRNAIGKVLKAQLRDQHRDIEHQEGRA